jgi:type IV secretory pathway TrbF-like protein
MRLIARGSALVIACSGCSHVQPAQSKTQTYVIDEDASGVGAALGTGDAGHDCDDALNKCFNKCWQSS